MFIGIVVDPGGNVKFSPELLISLPLLGDPTTDILELSLIVISFLIELSTIKYLFFILSK